jgi:hypothetical protein
MTYANFPGKPRFTRPTQADRERWDRQEAAFFSGATDQQPDNWPVRKDAAPPSGIRGSRDLDNATASSTHPSVLVGRFLFRALEQAMKEARDGTHTG